MITSALAYKGKSGILYLANVPKLKVDTPTANAKIIEKQSKKMINGLSNGFAFTK